MSLAALAALSGIPQGFEQGASFWDQQAYKSALAQLAQEQLRQQRLQSAAQTDLYSAFTQAPTPTVNAGAVPFGGGPAAPMPSAPAVPASPTAGGNQAGPAAGAGLAPTPMPSSPQASPAGGPALDNLIARDESGDRNIPNATFGTAGGGQGNFQITQTNWRAYAPKVGVDLGQYPTPMSAPRPVQQRVADYLRTQTPMGLRNWTDFNPKLASDVAKGGGASDTFQALGGQEAAAQAQPIAAQAAQSTPFAVQGTMTMPQLAQMIERGSPPGTPPEVKAQAFFMAAKMLAPAAKQQLEVLKLQMDERLREATLAQSKAIHDETAGIQRERLDIERAGLGGKGWQVQTLPDGRLVRVNVNTGEVKAVDLPAGTTRQGSQQPLPTEMKYPDKWPGMPDKPPPGVREDVWDATLFFARTHQMPAIGFQPGMRNLIIQAYPAALHGLGIPASQAADVSAAFAGERHAEIVGGGRAAQISLGINEAKKAAPQVVQTSQAVPRTQFPKANQFWNWLQQETGSPQIVQFKAALRTYLNVYASVVSRTGRLTDSQQNHAYELLSTAFNQGQIDAGIKQLNYEMELMQEAVPETMREMQGIGRPPGMAQPVPQGAAGGPGGAAGGGPGTAAPTLRWDGQKLVPIGQ
jgi:hypothetical protein